MNTMARILEKRNNFSPGISKSAFTDLICSCFVLQANLPAKNAEYCVK